MPLIAGYSLGPYEVLTLLGAGGMGEVYRAKDTKLGRDVALKILPASFTNDPERLARFRREAQVLASLNHPHIGAIYGLDEANGQQFLVLELVDGESLDKRIARGRIPVDEALAIAKQIAEALEAAHDKGIIHRDLKPANIALSRDGTVKVLDFGLAKATEAAGGASFDLANSPTITSPAMMTVVGMILGTAAYMSPEQARGLSVDKRTDIWAFGVVLYEMLTAKRLFKRETVTDTLAAVIKEDPDWDRVPAKARLLLRRCLEKDPKQRLRDIGDAMPTWEAAPETAPSDRRHARLWSSAAALFVVALGLAVFILWSERPDVLREVRRYQILPPEHEAFDNSMSLSPDGRKLAFTAGGRLWLRDIDSLDSRPLERTEGADLPFWSPDSRSIAFGDVSTLKKVDVSGGPPQVLCEVPTVIGGGSWNTEGAIIFGSKNSGPVWRVSEAGGTATAITKLDSSLQETNQAVPFFLPDGRHFLYVRVFGIEENNGIYVGSLDAKPEKQAGEPLLPVLSRAVYVPSSGSGVGQLLFVRDRMLMTQAFDERRLELTGNPVPLAERENVSGTLSFFTASANGVLAYKAADMQSAQLSWVDRQGKTLEVMGEPGPIGAAVLSPDGRGVAVEREDVQTGQWDIWLQDVARGAMSRFTFATPAGGLDSPVWSPDGSHIAFTARSGNPWLYEKASSGAVPEVMLARRLFFAYPTDWSREGPYIIETAWDPKTKFDIWVLPLGGDKKRVPIIQTPSNEKHGRVSSNGQWLAYQSDETKRDEVYVQSFPTPEGKLQVSTHGGTFPVWSRDGRELFFLGAGKLMAVGMKSSVGQRAEASVPKPLFDLPRGVDSFDVSKDGRFLIPTPVGQPVSAPITVVVNWQAGLKK